MKKFFLTLLKCVLFFMGWALIIGYTPDSNSDNQSIMRLWYEFTPFLVVMIFTILFVLLIEKNNIKVSIFKYFKRNILIGFITGILWIASVVCVFLINGSMKIEGQNSVDYLSVWILSLFFNVIMQELLIRGYLYQLLKKKYSVLVAGFITTMLFVVMHGGIFEAGFVPLFNLITMSFLITLILEYTGSLLAPITAHFIWNLVGGIILGGISLPDDYPNIFISVFQGDTLLSGGEYRFEGSIIVLIVNFLFIIYFLVLSKKRNKFNKYKKK